MAVLGACLAWGIDNNLTRKVSLPDATWIASVKGMSAGVVNLVLAFSLGATMPTWPDVAGAMVVDFLAYGVSLALFVVGLRHLGTARTGAYFSVAPFIEARLRGVLRQGRGVRDDLEGGAIRQGQSGQQTHRHAFWRLKFSECYLKKHSDRVGFNDKHRVVTSFPGFRHSPVLILCGA